MDRRTLIGILIIFAIFFLSEQFIWKKTKQPAKTASPAAQKATQTQPDTVKSILPVTSAGSTILTPANQTLAKAENVTLENDSLQIVFSTQGAVIKQATLKKYQLANLQNVQLIPQNTDITNVVLNLDKVALDMHSAVFQYEKINENGFPGIRFYTQTDSANIFEKKFILKHQYGISMDMKLRSSAGITGYRMYFNSGINHTEEYLKTKNQDYKFFAQVNNAPLKKDLSKLVKATAGFSGKIDWAAIRSKYFVIASLQYAPVLVNSVEADTANGSPSYYLTAKLDKPTSELQEKYLLYLGPAQFELLKSHGSGMENIAERGAKWLRWLVDIFAWILSFLYNLIPNYGVVIIIFSIFIKIILHPFTHKSMDASLKMQKIQPQVAALQAQYKNDPKKMQTELSKLYKEAGASPLGGCLPLLFQMPVFFALYTVLRFSLDMRQANFIGWLKDLSEPDPYYIMPILMSIFMIVQQLMMSPKKAALEQMDEKQQAMQQSQKMMTWIMPVVMFFVFKSMPAGLVLYWTLFNVFSIIQQYYLQKKFNNEATT